MKKYSVIIPTWKNIEFLDLAYKGLVRNSAAEHEIIIFFNEMDSECGRWLKGKKVLSLGSETNLGVCGAVNRAASRATSEHVVFLNDDMYVLPGWDTAFEQYLGMADKLWLSGTAVEAGRATPCYVGGHDYGATPATFREDAILREFGALKRPYNVVSTWTPTLIPRSNWDAIGGFDENYFPGYGSDPDLAMKMYQYGCRHFVGVGSCLVYHFSRRTVSRFDKSPPMDAKAYFEKKWGFSWRYFHERMIFRDHVITPALMDRIAGRKSSRWSSFLFPES